MEITSLGGFLQQHTQRGKNKWFLPLWWTKVFYQTLHSNTTIGEWGRRGQVVFTCEGKIDTRGKTKTNRGTHTTHKKTFFATHMMVQLSYIY